MKADLASNMEKSHLPKIWDQSNRFSLVVLNDKGIIAIESFCLKLMKISVYFLNSTQPLMHWSSIKILWAIHKRRCPFLFLYFWPLASPSSALKSKETIETIIWKTPFPLIVDVFYGGPFPLRITNIYQERALNIVLMSLISS